jgi:hypothetical protein
MSQPSIDLRPSRLDIDALLKSTSLDAIMRRDALEGRSILFGGEASSKSPPDAYGRLSASELDISLGEFDERIRTIVKSVFLQAGALV